MTQITTEKCEDIGNYNKGFEVTDDSEKGHKEDDSEKSPENKNPVIERSVKFVTITLWLII